jgi:DNA-binding transcriptional LysR family regulator
MHATVRQLQLFLALAEAGSVTAAARACHVTQPTVSMQLRDLAESVGLPLYNQLGKQLRLTEAGEALGGGRSWAGVLSRHAIAGLADGDGLTELKVDGFPAQSNWFVLHPTDHRPSPVVIEFLAHLRASAKELTASMSGAVLA